MRYLQGENLDKFSKIMGDAGICTNENIVPRNVRLYERSGGKYYLPLVAPGTNPETYRERRYGDLTTLFVDRREHACFPQTGRLKAFRLEPATRRLYLFTDEDSPDGSYVQGERAASADFFEGGCAAFPLVIQNHNIAPCTIDPNYEKRSLFLTIATGRDGKRYHTSVIRSIADYYKTPYYERADLYRRMTEPCTSLCTAAPLPVGHDTDKPFTYLLNPTGVLATAIERRQGFSPLVYATIFPMTTLVKLAKFYLPDTENEDLDNVIAESAISTDLIITSSVDQLYGAFATDNHQQYLILVDLADEFELIY